MMSTDAVWLLGICVSSAMMGPSWTELNCSDDIFVEKYFARCNALGQAAITAFLLSFSDKSPVWWMILAGLHVPWMETDLRVQYWKQ